MRTAGFVTASGLFVAACGGKGGSTADVQAPGGGPGTEVETATPVEPPGPPLPPPPADFARADLVTIERGTVTAWSLAGGKVEKLGGVALATPDPEDYAAQLSGDWIDHGHLAVWIPPREVVVMSAEKIRRVAVPPQPEFRTAKPETDDPDGLTEGGVMEESGTGLVTFDNAAWWVECPWGYPYDGWQCEVYTHARLWPDPGKVTTGDVDQMRWSFASDAPAGYRLKELDDGRALGCTPPPGTKQRQTQLKGFEDDGEMIYEHHWIATSPPRLLVIYGVPGMDDLSPVRWTLHDGCLERPLAQGTDVQPGPAGLWLAHETNDPRAEDVKTRPVIRRGADLFGELPTDTGLVRFRPVAR